MSSLSTPWFKEGSGIGALVRDCQGRIVACRHRMSAMRNEDQMTLIAAAPDLISALERMEFAFYLLLQSKPVSDAGEVLAEANAAIAKAKGHSL